MTKLEKSRTLVRQSLIGLDISIAILFVASLIRHDFSLILGAVVSLISLALCGYANYLNPTRISGRI